MLLPAPGLGTRCICGRSCRHSPPLRALEKIDQMSSCTNCRAKDEWEQRVQAEARRPLQQRKSVRPHVLMGKVEIHVCQSGTCSAYGGEAVLTEIEELAKDFSEVCVRESGCLGLCSQAPAALTVKTSENRRAEEMVHVRINSFEDSAKIVERAAGQKIALEDPVVKEKFAHLRAARAREHAVTVFKWNMALRGLADQAEQQPHLRFELQDLLSKAGFPGGVKSWMPGCIEMYTRWTLESVMPVSKHSALFSFKSGDRKRGTPHIRGRGVRPEPRTWHTTMLAETGSQHATTRTRAHAHTHTRTHILTHMDTHTPTGQTLRDHCRGLSATIRQLAVPRSGNQGAATS